MVILIAVTIVLAIMYVKLRSWICRLVDKDEQLPGKVMRYPVLGRLARSVYVKQVESKRKNSLRAGNRSTV